MNKTMRNCMVGLLGIAAGMGGWYQYRNEKYPVVKGYRGLNQFFFPSQILTLKTIAKSNQYIKKMKQPQPPEGILKTTTSIRTEQGASIGLTIYEPKCNEVLPCLVYYHGGGFVFEDAWYIHEIVAGYAKDAHCKVIFVQYRTADVAPFPAPFQDCCAALSYVWNNSEALSVDKMRIAVGGDSAGGALAAACAIWARDCTNIKLCFQMLIYPVTDCRMETESMKRYVDSPLWNARLNQKMWDIYLRNGDKDLLHYASPMLAENLKQLPSAYIEVEEWDCLHDEGLAYANRLQTSGVAVQVEDVKGTCHGFDAFDTEVTRCLLQVRKEALRQAFWK